MKQLKVVAVGFFAVGLLFVASALGQSRAKLSSRVERVVEPELNTFHEIELEGGKFILPMSISLTRLVDDWVFQARLHGIDTSRITTMEGLYFVDIGKVNPIDNKNFGITYFREERAKSMVLINEKLLPTYIPTFIQAVMYHELYHVLFPMEGHIKKGDKDFVYFLQDGGNIDPETVIKTWDYKTINNYFNYIKNKQNNLK